MSDEVIRLIAFAWSVGAASAFCSLAESSIVGLSDVGVKQVRKKSAKKGDMLLNLMANRSKYMSAIIMLNTIINISGSMIAGTMASESLADSTSSYLTYGTFLATMTVMMLLFSEIKPKVYAAQHSETVAIVLYYPIRMIAWLLSPIVNAVNGFLNNKESSGKSMSLVDVEHLICMASESGALRKEETNLVINALKLREKSASDIIKEESVLKVNLVDKVKDHQETIINSCHGKIVLVNRLNQPVGAVLKEDALISLINDKEARFADIIYPLPSVNVNYSLSEIAQDISKSPIKMLAVVNDEKALVGVIGLTDIKEALFNSY